MLFALLVCTIAIEAQAATVLSGTVGEGSLLVETIDYQGENKTVVLVATDANISMPALSPESDLHCYTSNSADLKTPSNPFKIIQKEFYFFPSDGVGFRIGEPLDEWYNLTPPQQSESKTYMQEVADITGFPYSQAASFPYEVGTAATAILVRSIDFDFGGLATDFMTTVAAIVAVAIGVGLDLFLLRQSVSFVHNFTG